MVRRHCFGHFRHEIGRPGEARVVVGAVEPTESPVAVAIARATAASSATSVSTKTASAPVTGSPRRPPRLPRLEIGEDDARAPRREETLAARPIPDGPRDERDASLEFVRLRNRIAMAILLACSGAAPRRLCQNPRMGRLDGKVALISGAARGQGEAEARRFVAEGARVVLGDVLETECRTVAESLGDGARAIRLDVTREEDWSRAVETALDAFGRLDVLVNNAGIVRTGAIESTSLEDYRAVVDVNQIGTFLGMRAVVPAIARPRRSIVARRTRGWKAFRA